MSFFESINKELSVELESKINSEEKHDVITFRELLVLLGQLPENEDVHFKQRMLKTKGGHLIDDNASPAEVSNYLDKNYGSSDGVNFYTVVSSTSKRSLPNVTLYKIRVSKESSSSYLTHCDLEFKVVEEDFEEGKREISFSDAFKALSSVPEEVTINSTKYGYNVVTAELNSKTALEYLNQHCKPDDENLVEGTMFKIEQENDLIKTVLNLEKKPIEFVGRNSIYCSDSTSKVMIEYVVKK
jgi:hypothetical protein